MRVADLEVLGLCNVALVADGDGQSGGLVAGELGELGRLLGLPRCGCSRLSLAGSLLCGLARSGFDFGLLLWS